MNKTIKISEFEAYNVKYYHNQLELHLTSCFIYMSLTLF